MNITLISYKMASWGLVIGGLVHTITDLLSPTTPEREEIILQMTEFTGKLFGMEFNLYSFHQGFSLTMGLFLIGYGALNVLILKNNQQAESPSNILILNIIVTLVSVLLSIKYFFIVPTILTSIPLLGFLISYITKTRRA